MKRMFGVALALALGATVAQAQIVPRPIRFGIGGGLSGVTGNLAEGVDPGFNATALLDITAPLFPIGLRVDGSFNQFNGKAELEDYKFRILNVTADAVFSPLPLPIVKPYVLGGVGMYNRKIDVEGAEATTKVGFNVGAGVRFDLAGFGAFAEARYHMVGEDDSFEKTNFYPIIVGLRF